MTDPDLSTGLHDLMVRSLDDLPTPTERLRSGSLRRGRAVRRRRRAGVALGGVALLATVSVVVLPALAGSQADEGTVATDPGNPQPRSAEPPPGRWDMPGGVMLHRVEDLLPDGMTTTDENLGDQELAPGEEPGGGWFATDLVNEDGDTVGGLNIVLYPPADDHGAFIDDHTTCPEPAGTACTELLDGDGNIIGRTSRFDTAGVIVREVTLIGPDEGLLYIADSNSADDKWGEGSTVAAAAPPLSFAQLRMILSDPTWLDWTPPAG
jgi:hypothetical protein